MSAFTAWWHRNARSVFTIALTLVLVHGVHLRRDVMDLLSRQAVVEATRWTRQDALEQRAALAQRIEFLEIILEQHFLSDDPQAAEQLRRAAARRMSQNE